MKYKEEKHRLLIIPENEMDEVYLENVLSLHKKGDTATITRVSAMGLDSSWAYAECRKKEK